MAANSSPDADIVYGVGGATLFRFDRKEMAMQAHALNISQVLRNIDCPEAETCYLVGDHGVILKVSLP